MSEAIDGEGKKQWFIDTYQDWVEQEGLPILKAYGVQDLLAVPLQPWRRKGGLGAFIQLAGAENVNDAYLCEIPPGVSLHPQKHLFDELIYVLSGSGATTIWNDSSAKQIIEWQEGSLFATPLNAWHQHFNTRGNKPTRFIGVTLAPIYMNLFNDADFIFHNDYEFKKRYAGEGDYFSGKGQFLQERVWETNFVPDVRNFKLAMHNARGAGGTNIRFAMADSVMEAHASEFPVGTYKKAHRHSPGAHVIILSGTGYTLMWKDDQPPVRIDWRAGSMLVPPGWWFHQHFNTGEEPARYLALKAGEGRKFRGIMPHSQSYKNIKLGGDQIEYADENPEIRGLYREALAKSGVMWQMEQFFPGE